ncbi:MAG: hypothetical protein JNM00_12085 [Flavobacteriales bacterium]|nr:hypothetical protein [Flavobacteriales bacterium]
MKWNKWSGLPGRFSYALIGLCMVLVYPGCTSPGKQLSVSNGTLQGNQEKVIDGNAFPYDLSLPNSEFQLPFILNEVSGLTDIDTAHIACVQDEIGSIFIYNFINDSLVYEHQFDEPGDFEGLTYTQDEIFILRSDGRLTAWTDFDPVAGGKRLQHWQLPLQTSNNEGLCYDSSFGRLLIAAKGKPDNPERKNERLIYSFDLKKRRLETDPVYSLSTSEIQAAAHRFGIEQEAYTAKGKPKPMNFRPSSLAVHPRTSEIYIISAVDRILLSIDRMGKITFMTRLDPAMFAKAEGITFLSDGTMIITNEAAGVVPTLLVFKAEG